MSLIMTVEIPALDRLCDILEERQRVGIIEELKNEICKQLREAAESGAPRPGFREVAPGEDHPWKDEAAQNAQEGPKEPPKAEPTEKPTAPVEATHETKSVTLADVQKAAAQMRDDGKLEAVKALFPGFGIRKLSDLKGDALQGFAAKLREMGAKI